MGIKSSYLEVGFVVLFITLFLYLGMGNLLDHRIAHEFPYAHLASDAFQHQNRAESIKQMGNYRYEAPYVAAGFKDSVIFYMPAMYHMSVLLSHMSGLETHDTNYFLVFLAFTLSILLVYFLIRRFNSKVALLSLPLAFVIFTPRLRNSSKT